LNIPRSIILKGQEMIIWKDNLEKGLKEKDREQAYIQKLETEFCSINSLKESLINIGKTRNKRKKKQIEIDHIENIKKLLTLKINQKIDGVVISSLYNDSIA
jgi:hypothetical protein